MENNSFFSSPLFRNIALAVLGLLALFLFAKAIVEFQKWGTADDMVYNSITVTGKGEVFAMPDVATFTFSVNETGKDVAEAQNKATAKNEAALKYLKDNGVEDKDIKTIGYFANPRYEYRAAACTQFSCPQGNSVLVGYEVNQTIEVKVRDLNKAGTLLSGIGATGVSNISGLSFTVDDEESLKAEARALAIEDAKEKAEKLADDLDINLGKVMSFYEDQYGYPMPYGRDFGGAGMEANSTKAMAPQAVPSGESKVSITVNVTYKIK